MGCTVPAWGTVAALDFDQREVVLRVDFDDLDDEGCLHVSMHFMNGPRHPLKGEPVYLMDCNGDGCAADVLDVTGWSARVRPDWSTWIGRRDLPAGVRRVPGPPPGAAPPHGRPPAAPPA